MALSYSEISQFLEEASKTKPLTEGSFTIGPEHRGAMKGSKIYNKGKSTTNPNEKDAFLKKSGAQLPPLAQKKPSTQMAGYQPEGELIEETDMRFCPKCEKTESREECAYGPDYWDKFAIKNVSKKVEESAAWQRSEGKNKKGGLNEKGRKSYERENPGSDLKAPQPEGGPRKRSFCARMGGMKGAMKKPNGEPTRKALALRKWKC